MDPHSFIARAEAQRWLGIAEKLLIGNDVVGSKTFAIRARESDPRLEAADQILAITDTLLAADKRVAGSNGTQPDFYAILQLVQFVQDADHIAAQYRRLAVILNPHQNRFPYADQAFQLVNDAYAVLSNPMRKSLYDSDIDFPQQPLQMNNLGFNIEQHHHQQQHQHNFFSINRLATSREPEFQPRVSTGQQLHQHNFLPQNPVRSGEQLFLFQQQTQPFQVPVPVMQPPSPPPAPPQAPFSWPQVPPLSQPQPPQQQEQPQQFQPQHESPQQEVEVETEVEEERGDESVNDSTFWTTCPYCFYMYEYPSEYAECVLRCDTCKRAFQAVRISSPPQIAEDQESYYYCWGFFPLAVSISHMQKNSGGGGNKVNANWAPFSPMYDVSSHVKDQFKDQLKDQLKDDLSEKAAPKTNLFVNENMGSTIYIDDETDDIFEGISEPSEDSDLEWNTSKKKKAKRVTKDRVTKDIRNGNVKNASSLSGSKKSSGVTTRRQRAAKEMGKLDLNVEFNNNEGEEVTARTGAGNRGSGQGDGDNIEGIGFFEGLDEFFSSLPILSVVNDDKVKAA